MKTLELNELQDTLPSLLTELEAKREGFYVARNGKAIARVLPMTQQDVDPLFGFYRGKLEIKGDILSPLYSDEELEEFEERSAAQFK